MRTKMEFEARGDGPPMLRFFIFHAPHYRHCVEVILAYRREITAAVRRAGVPTPIDYPVDVDITFIDPSSPDLGNLYLAFERAVDGNTLSSEPAALVDDGLIHGQATRKLYPNARQEPRQPVQLPRFSPMPAVA